MEFAVKKTPGEWKSILTNEEYDVLRMKGTEKPGHSSEYNEFEPKEGFFACRACENPIYSASAKFHSGCGWPSFDKCYKGSVATVEDRSGGSVRTEIVCSRCGGHLGHVFANEKFTDTNERHCVNSVSVKYNKGNPENAQPEEKVLN